jgi:hypothetical protein
MEGGEGMITETQLIGLHVTGTPKKATVKVVRHVFRDKDDYVGELIVTVGSRTQRILLKGGDLYDLTKGLITVMQMNMTQEE